MLCLIMKKPLFGMGFWFPGKLQYDPPHMRPGSPTAGLVPIRSNEAASSLAGCSFQRHASISSPTQPISAAKSCENRCLDHAMRLVHVSSLTSAAV